MADIGNLTVRIQASLGNFHAGMRDAQNSLMRLDQAGRISSVGLMRSFQTFAKISTTIYVVKQALDHLLGPTMEIGRSFESAMYKMKVAADLSAEEFTKASAYAKQLGNDISLPGVSAEDAAIAMMEMARAGMDLNEVMAAAPGVLSMAKLGEMDVGEAAKMSAKLLNTFGLEGERATDIADYLGRAAQKSSAELDELVYGMSSGSAVLDMTNQSVENMIISLAMLSDNLVEGEEAGTAMKTMMMRLIDPAGNGADLMNQYGIEVRDLATGKIKDMPDLIDEFTEKLKDLTPAQKDEALATIFGTKAIKGAHLILASGRDKWNEYADGILQGKDSQQMLIDQMPPFERALENVKNMVSNWQIDFWENYLGPGFTSAMEGTMNFIGRLGILKDNLEAGVAFEDSWVGVWAEDSYEAHIVMTIGEWGDALEDFGKKVEDVAGKVKDKFGEIDWSAENTHKVLDVVFGILIARMGIMATSFVVRSALVVLSWFAMQVAAVVSVAVQLIRIALLITKFVVLAITAVVQGAIVIAMYAAQADAATISAMVQIGALGKIGKAWKALTTLITGTALWNILFGAGAKKGAPGQIFNLPKGQIGVWQRFIALLSKYQIIAAGGVYGLGIFSAIAQAGGAYIVVEKLVEKFGMLKTTLIDLGGGAIAGIFAPVFFTVMHTVVAVKALGKAFQWLKDNGLKGLTGKILQGLKALPGLFGKLFSSLWGGIKGAGGGIGNFAKGLGESLINGLKSLPGMMIGLGSLLVRGLWQGVLGGVYWITRIMLFIPGQIFQHFGDMIDAGRKLGGWIWDGLKSIPGRITDAVNWLITTFKNGWNSFSTYIWNSGMDALNWLVEGIKNMPGNIIDAALWIKDTFVNGIKSAYNWIKETGNRVVDWIVEGIKALPDKITSAAITVKDWLVTEFHNLYNDFKTIGGDILNGIWDGIMAVKDWIGNKFDDLKNAFVTGIKDAFGIDSPAKEMIPLGHALGWGLLEGFLNTAEGMGAAIKEVFGSAVSGAWHFIKKGWASVADFPGLVAGGLGSFFGGDGGQSAMERGLAFAMSKVGLPYVWGGGHGIFGTDIFNLQGYDCSGFVSAVLQAMGMPYAGTTYSLYDAFLANGWQRGDGLVTVGFYPDLSHVGIGIQDQWFESGGGYGGVARSSGSNFPIHLTPFIMPELPFAYRHGGISMTPQLAEVGAGGPEIHLTKDNVDEFFGDRGQIIVNNPVFPNVTNVKEFARELGNLQKRKTYTRAGGFA